MASTMTDTASIDVAEGLLSSSRLLGSSFESLSSPRQTSSLISKTYKQASNFYLTRRLVEALSTIEPIVTGPKVPDEDNIEDEPPAQAPVASASHGSRIKVWSFYLTLVNAIIELGSEEGKAIFGNKEWKSLSAKVQDGSIWEEVVQTGYSGIEGNVDSEVVVSL